MQITITPTEPQFTLLNSPLRFPAFVAGFGAGKSEAAVYRSILGSLKYPNNDRGFYEPTWDLVRTIAFPRFEKVLTEWGLPYKLYKNPLNYIDIENYGKIYFRSMEVPERIIGYEHADADVDELDTLKTDKARDVWARIQSRNRQKKPDNSSNSCAVFTTPEGFRFVYQMWKKDPPSMEYSIIKASTYSNPHLPVDYVQSLKDSYPAEILAAYLNGEFVNMASGTVFNSFDRFKCNSNETIQEKEPLFIGMDFNVTNMSAVVYVRRGDEWHAVEEHTKIYDTPSMISHLKSKYPEHNITVYPDASGKSRKTVDASISDIALLQQADFRVKAKDSNPLVKDRIIATNGAFSHDRVRVNTKKCKEFTEALEQLAYNDKGEPDKDSGLDHITDAGTYPLAYEMPIRKPIQQIQVSFL